jgi:hypothetical protein
MDPSDDRLTSAPEDQIELLTQLVERARARGIRTGVPNDEIKDLDQDGAAELIEQLQRRLGEAKG